MYLSKAEILPIYQLALTIAQKVFHLLTLFCFIIAYWKLELARSRLPYLIAPSSVRELI